jgi:hypothetical protein
MSTALVATGVQYPDATIQYTQAYREIGSVVNTYDLTNVGTSVTWTPTVGFNRYEVTLAKLTYSSGPLSSFITFGTSSAANSNIYWHGRAFSYNSTYGGTSTSFSSPTLVSYGNWDQLRLIVEKCGSPYGTGAQVWDISIQARSYYTEYFLRGKFVGGYGSYPTNFVLASPYSQTITGYTAEF